MTEKDVVFGDKGAFNPQSDYDAERKGSSGSRRGSTVVNGRKMSRIGPPPKMSLSAGDSDQDDGHARLVDAEANNAIQYRTCSWQKVR